ncbi:MAG: type I DNA topoisomerase [candidate division Zixibacteria bacterium]|nr:type I DNA topoisomerase [candidate division Zixibacteria bacterium]
MNKVNAQQARRVLDRIVGYTVSPFLWKTIARNLSAGRVQSVALRLICEREEEIDAFKEEEYWQIMAKLETAKKIAFEARVYKIGGKTVGTPIDSVKNKIIVRSEKEVKKYITELQKYDYTVNEVSKTEKNRKPYAPFITSTLQQEAARVMGIAPKQTMRIAQELYEGVELGKEGSVGLITYMRTDSTRISDVAIKSVRKHIESEYGKDYLPAKPNFYGKKKGAQDAHEAIRPTDLSLTPAKAKKYLKPKELKLYSLIWKRFVASQMNNAKYDVETVIIEGGKFLLRTSAQRVKFDGFLKVYEETKEPDENGSGENGNRKIPKLKEGDKIKLNELYSNQSFTKPPPRYSEAMLVKRLEADGIGRPSTYASIISTLKDRKYANGEDRKLTPTELGKTVKRILVESLPDIFNVKFTAEMEKELDLVEDGTDDWVDVLNNFYKPFMKTINSLKGQEKKIKESLTEETNIKCEKCKSKMIIKWGRNGRFLACSAYPECKSTRPLPEEEAQSKTDEKCEKCGSDMIIKTGRFGRFMACSAYPDCKNAKPLSLGIKCPKPSCGGKIVEKQTKSRRLFYGCSNYPKCDFASWDKPTDVPCPVCNHPFLVKKSTKAKGDFLRCPECKHEKELQSAEAKPKTKTKTVTS